MDKQELLFQKNTLERLIEALQLELKEAPQGRLRISQKRRQYYVVSERGDTKGRYLPKSELAVASKLAQRDYNQKLLEACKAQLCVLIQFLETYDFEQLGEVYEEMVPTKRELVAPKVLRWEVFAKAWQETPYLGKGFAEGDRHYETMRGEKVRSKSEVIIANILMELGIPYKYECPLKLKNGRTIYPDFTILPIGRRKEVYMEHFGMMDLENYLDSFFLKISTMLQSGFVPGENYFMSFESEQHPLNTKDVYTLLKQFS